MDGPFMSEYSEAFLKKILLQYGTMGNDVMTDSSDSVKEKT
jgi:hypothetical protein